MKRIFALLLLTALTFTSCNNDEQIILADKIDSKVQKIIASKNDSLIQAMRASNLSIYKAIGTDDFKKNLQSRTRNVAWAFRKQYTDGSYKVFDQYHIINGVKTSRAEITSATKGYTFKWTNVGKETYISMLKLPFIHQDYLLILQYVNNGSGKWQINRMDITPVGRYGLTPTDFLAEAKKMEKDGHILDAYFYAGTAVAWCEDIEGDIVFNVATEAQGYKEELAEVLNKKYPFPKEVTQIKTRPVITDVSVKTAVEGMFPMVVYESAIEGDSLALVSEYEQLRRLVPRMYPDMDFNKKYVVYTVVRNQPDGSGGIKQVSNEFRYKKGE